MTHTRIKLSVATKDFPRQEYVFEEPTQCVLGRGEDCDIQAPTDWGHAAISRHHCLFDVEPPVIRVRDLGSRNGTYVNGEPIGKRPRDVDPEKVDLREFDEHELKDGDEVRVGHTILRVAIDEDNEGTVFSHSCASHDEA